MGSLHSRWGIISWPCFFRYVGMLRLSIPSSNSLTMPMSETERKPAACTSEVSSNAHIWNPQAAQHSVSNTSPGACVRCYAANRVILSRKNKCISLGPAFQGNQRENSLLVLLSFPRWMLSSGHCFLMNSIVENHIFPSVFNHLLSFFTCLPQCLSPVWTHGRQLSDNRPNRLTLLKGRIFSDCVPAAITQTRQFNENKEQMLVYWAACMPHLQGADLQTQLRLFAHICTTCV